MARHRPFDRVVINGVWYDAYVEYSSDAGGTFNAGDPVYVDTDHPGIAFTQEGIRWLNLAQATFSILNKIDISHHSRRFLEPFHDTRTVGAQYVNPSHKGAHLVAVGRLDHSVVVAASAHRQLHHRHSHLQGQGPTMNACVSKVHARCAALLKAIDKHRWEARTEDRKALRVLAISGRIHMEKASESSATIEALDALFDFVDHVETNVSVNEGWEQWVPRHLQRAQRCSLRLGRGLSVTTASVTIVHEVPHPRPLYALEGRDRQALLLAHQDSARTRVQAKTSAA